MHTIWDKSCNLTQVSVSIDIKAHKTKLLCNQADFPSWQISGPLPTRTLPLLHHPTAIRMCLSLCPNGWRHIRCATRRRYSSTCKGGGGGEVWDGVGLVEGDKRCAREEDVNAVLALQIWSDTHARTRKSTHGHARTTLQAYHLHFKLVAACRVCSTHRLFHLRHTLAR